MITLYSNQGVAHNETVHGTYLMCIYLSVDTDYNDVSHCPEI